MTDRAAGSRPGAFQAVCERPAHGPVCFKRRAVAERASLTLLGAARDGRVSSPRLTGRQLHDTPRQSHAIRVSTPRAMLATRHPSQYPCLGPGGSRAVSLKLNAPFESVPPGSR